MAKRKQAKRDPLPAVSELTPPTSMAARWDVAILLTSEGCEARACAAALGLCWRKFLRQNPYSGNALGYGGRVVDALLQEGYGMGEISIAASGALGVITEGLVDIEGAEDFGAPPDGPDGTVSGGKLTSAST